MFYVRAAKKLRIIESFVTDWIFTRYLRDKVVNQSLFIIYVDFNVKRLVCYSS
jgi:hypothetical protein